VTKSRGILGPRKRWTDYEREVLRAHYARTLTADLAELLGHTLSSTHQQARKLGLVKSVEWIAETAKARIESDPNHGSRRSRLRPGNVPANKGVKHPKGWAPGDMARTQFKRGRPACEARNYVPIGSLRISKDGYAERKVTDDPSIVPARRWVGVHRLVWMEAHGPIPADCVIAFRPGMRTSVPEEITLDRLECITRAENARRNQMAPEIRPIVQLRGAITRQINKRLKEQTA
jgi:hypothetical protein